MAKKQKSETRKLAELVAKQRGIKVRSAQNWLYRISAGKVKTPKYELTNYARKKVRSFVETKKAERIRRSPAGRAPAAPERSRRRYNFGEGESRIITVKAKWNYYGQDKRRRPIRFYLEGEDLNDFLNAEDLDGAMQILKDTNQFLAGATIEDFEYFEGFGGLRTETFWEG